MLPLRGRRILVTRTREQGSVLVSALRGRGAEVLEVPTIRIAPPVSYAPLDAALKRLGEFDVLLVTSANTARVLVSRCPVPWVVQPYTVAIGPATGEALRGCGLRVDLQPSPSIAESVVRELAPAACGKRMLLARAEVGRDVLPEGLRAAGAVVEVVDAYRTLLDEAAGLSLRSVFGADAPAVDAVTFTSSSTVRNFFALMGDEEARTVLAQSAVCSIGPVTTGTLRELGVEPTAEARQHDVQGLVAAIVEWLSSVSL